jgi:hypothetical protein
LFQGFSALIDAPAENKGHSAGHIKIFPTLKLFSCLGCLMNIEAVFGAAFWVIPNGKDEKL